MTNELIIALTIVALVAGFITYKNKKDKKAQEIVPPSSNMPAGKLWEGDVAHSIYTSEFADKHFDREVTIPMDKANWSMMCASVYDVKSSNAYVDNPVKGDWFGIHGFDCKAFALAFRKNAGLPHGSVRMATCKTADFYHAVALVFTDRGVYALDNRYDKPMPWADLNYTEWAVETINGQWSLLS